MTRNHALRLVLLVLLLLPAPASAQPDPMEEQRCVWSCLSRSRGASDPAYDACVRARCMGGAAQGKTSAAPAPRPHPAGPLASGLKSEAMASRPVPVAPPRGQAWKTVTDLGYPAVAQCRPVAGRPNLCLVVACPARGGLSLELYGLEDGLAGAPLRLATEAALFDLTLPARDADGAGYRWPMPIGLAASLKAGSEVQLDLGGRGYRLSLAGSGSAIGEIEARCR